MKYNIDKVPMGTPVIKAFPQLAEHVEFSNPKDDELSRIVIFSVDHESPFVELYRDDFSRRISKIFDHLNITGKKKKEDIVNGKSIKYGRMATKWLMISDNYLYGIWYSLHMNFYQLISYMQKPLDFEGDIEKNIDRRLKIEQRLNESHSKLVSYERQLFSDATTRRIVKEEVAKVIQFPEKFAMDTQVI